MDFVRAVNLLSSFGFFSTSCLHLFRCIGLTRLVCLHAHPMQCCFQAAINVQSYRLIFGITIDLAHVWCMYLNKLSLFCVCIVRHIKFSFLDYSCVILKIWARLVDLLPSRSVRLSTFFKVQAIYVEKLFILVTFRNIVTIVEANT